MNFAQLVDANRSYRRFDAGHALSADQLRRLVEYARHCPSAMNRQPLKYIICCSPEQNAAVYATLAWAGALKDWAGPEPHERPTGYIIILADTDIAPNAAKDIASVDVGIVAQTILLGAAEMGLGGCMLGAVTRPALRAALDISDRFEIPLVVALGKPVEKIVLEDVPAGRPVTYYREPDGTHHVPKRTIDELLVATFG